MTTTEWVEVATLAITVITIIVHVERRMGKALTREEHERICMERNERVEKQLENLRDDMQARHKENCGKFDRIEEGINSTHQRLDDLYRDLIGRSGRR